MERVQYLGAQFLKENFWSNREVEPENKHVEVDNFFYEMT